MQPLFYLLCNEEHLRSVSQSFGSEVMKSRVATPCWTLEEKQIHNPNRNGEKLGAPRGVSLEEH